MKTISRSELDTYQIAEMIVGMRVSGKTAKQSEAYRCSDDLFPEIAIAPDVEAFHENHPYLSMDDCEYMATAGSFYTQILDHDGMLLHSSCVVVDGYAYLFSAPSGTGKSTHTGYWMQRFGDRAYILNDDKPALRRRDGKWFVYGTPWSGKTDLNRNEKVPLGGIGILCRGEENHAKRITGVAAVYALLDQTVRPTSEARLKKLMELIKALVENEKIYCVTANMSPQAADVAYAAMRADKEDKK